jgi:hypothetical protein
MMESEVYRRKVARCLPRELQPGAAVRTEVLAIHSRHGDSALAVRIIEQERLKPQQ